MKKTNRLQKFLFPIASSLAITLCLSACVPTALVLGATAGGAVIYDKRSMKAMGEDQSATHHAQRWIDYDPVLSKKAHVSVTVFNHVALLVGEAQSPEIRHRAELILGHIKHIKRVYNEINIAGATSELQRASDTWITTKVRSALLTRRGLNSNDIKIVTEEGVVYLMGSVTRAQASLATDATRRVSGVTKVVKIFAYT